MPISEPLTDERLGELAGWARTNSLFGWPTCKEVGSLVREVRKAREAEKAHTGEGLNPCC